MRWSDWKKVTVLLYGFVPEVFSMIEEVFSILLRSRSLQTNKDHFRRGYRLRIISNKCNSKQLKWVKILTLMFSNVTKFFLNIQNEWKCLTSKENNSFKSALFQQHEYERWVRKWENTCVSNYEPRLFLIIHCSTE